MSGPSPIRPSNGQGPFYRPIRAVKTAFGWIKKITLGALQAPFHPINTLNSLAKRVQVIYRALIGGEKKQVEREESNKRLIVDDQSPPGTPGALPSEPESEGRFLNIFEAPTTDYSELAKSVQEAVESCSVEKRRELMKELGQASTFLCDRMEIEDKRLSQEEKDTINTLYESIQRGRATLARQLSPDNPVVEMAIADTLKKGSFLYAAVNYDTLRGIIVNGIDMDLVLKEQKKSAWGDELELGQGVYFSTEEPSYLSEDKPYIIYVEMTENMEGLSIPQFGNLKRIPYEFSDEEIEKGFRSLAERDKVACLRGQGINPLSKSELVLYRPDKKIKITHVGMAGNVDVNDQDVIEKFPIDVSLEQNNWKLSDQWGN